MTTSALPSATTGAFPNLAAWKLDLLSVSVGFGYLVGAWPAGSR